MQNATIRELKPILATGDALLDTPKTAEQIRNSRAKLKIPQKVLAIEMGLSVAYLSDLERGNRRWSLALFNKAKQALERI